MAARGLLFCDGVFLAWGNSFPLFFTIAERHRSGIFLPPPRIDEMILRGLH